MIIETTIQVISKEYKNNVKEDPEESSCSYLQRNMDNHKLQGDSTHNIVDKPFHTPEYGSLWIVKQVTRLIPNSR